LTFARTVNQCENHFVIVGIFAETGESMSLRSVRADAQTHGTKSARTECTSERVQDEQGNHGQQFSAFVPGERNMSESQAMQLEMHRVERLKRTIAATKMYAGDIFVCETINL
jgi:hypothetical protein